MSTYDYKNQAMQHEYSDCFLDAVYTVHIQSLANSDKLTSACFSCPARFGGTELVILLVEALVCGDITAQQHTYSLV